MTKEPLRRFWFETETGYGIGVTAYSVEEAKLLINQSELTSSRDFVSITEDIDIRTLDQGHVIPNMGPPNLRGIWFPNLVIK